MQKEARTGTIVETLWRSGVASVNGEAVVRKALLEDRVENITHLIAVGKAAQSMYQGAAALLSARSRALLITKYNHIVQPDHLPAGTRVIESGHPVPDENSLRAGRQLLAFVKSIADTESAVMLVSGGASALAEHLPTNIGLDELQQMTQQLITDGHDIEQINRLRCRLSLIKGGRLLQHFRGRSIITYAISDVPDDDMRIIGSGIGSNQPVTEDDSPVPASIRPILDKAGATGMAPPAATGFDYRGRVVASNVLARKAVAEQAMQQGHEVIINQDMNRNQSSQDVRQVAEMMSDALIKNRPGIYIWGGEPTISLPADAGYGGRNQHLALLLAKTISGLDNIAVIVAGTDGTDGATPYAGAIINGETWSAHAEQALEQADSGTFLKQRGGLFRCGPTGTNVMDLAVALKI